MAPENDKFAERIARVETKLEVVLSSLDKSINRLTEKVAEIGVEKEKLTYLEARVNKHHEEDARIHLEVYEHMTTIRAYMKVAGILLVPLYGQFVVWIYNIITR